MQWGIWCLGAMILIIGCLLPPPLHPEATIPLDLLGANPAGAPLCAEVKCRSNFVLQFKELKEQGVGGGIYLTNHGALPPPTALRVLRAILHQLQGPGGALQTLEPELRCCTTASCGSACGPLLLLSFSHIL